MLQIFLPALSQVEECTIGVACGMSTQDGRPMIWKTRDYISEPNNVVHYNNSMDYSFIYVAGAGSSGVRMGVNEHGVAIANSSSSDLPDGSDTGLLNGDLLRQGLGSCLTVEEFQGILDNTNITGRRTNGNFVIIDSTGAASLFEVGEKVYWRYDASDYTSGYILRTNFSINGGGSSGIERFNRTTELVGDFYSGDSLNYKSILRYQMRDFSDIESNPYSVPYDGTIGAAPHGYIDTEKSICRNTSVSAVVITGIIPGEFPELSTMWTILGQPATSVALPYWPIDFPPEEADGEYYSPLCKVSLQIKDQLFDYNSDASFINTYKLLNGSGDGLWTNTFPYEDNVFSEVEAFLTTWRAQENLPSARMKVVEDSLAKDAKIYLQNCLYLVVSDPVVTAENELNPLVFPNPFDTEANLSYELTVKSNVYISVYTITGQLIQSYRHIEQEPGRHYQRLGSDLPPATGLFILNITVNNRTQTLKLVRHLR